MKKLKILAVFAILLVVVASVVSCAGRQPSASTTQKILKLGVIQPMTGPSGDFGTAAVNAIRVAVDHVNAAGGVLGAKVEIVVEDDASDKGQSVALLKKMAADPQVAAIIGPGYTGNFVAGAPVAADLSIVYISAFSVAPWSGEFNEWTFRPTVAMDKYTDDYLRMMAKDLKIKKVAAIYAPDNVSFSLYEKVLEQVAKEIGLELVSVTSSRQGDTNYASQISEMLRYSTDAIFITLLTNDTALFTAQLVDRGYKGYIIYTSSVPADPRVYELSQGKSKGAFLPLSFDPNEKRAVVQNFLKDYRARYGGQPTQWAVFAYDAATLLCDAIKRSGSLTDRRAIRDALGATSNFEGVQGPITIKGKGDNVTPAMHVIRIGDNGEWVTYK